MIYIYIKKGQLLQHGWGPAAPDSTYWVLEYLRSGLWSGGATTLVMIGILHMHAQKINGKNRAEERALRVNVVNFALWEERL